MIKGIYNNFLLWQNFLQSNQYSSGKETVDMITKEFGPGKAEFIQCNVQNVGDIQKTVQFCKNTFGRFDVMCNNVIFFFFFCKDILIAGVIKGRNWRIFWSI